jgi:hypothetical protein
MMTLHLKKIGAIDAAGRDFDQDLTRSWTRRGDLARTSLHPGLVRSTSMAVMVSNGHGGDLLALEIAYDKIVQRSKKTAPCLTVRMVIRITS